MHCFCKTDDETSFWVCSDSSLCVILNTDEVMQSNRTLNIFVLLFCKGSSRKTWRFLSYNKMKSILSFYANLLLKLSISKHFNYNIHSLNIVSVRWGPLLSAHPRKRRTSDKNLTHSFDVLRSAKWRLSSWTFSFCGRHCFSPTKVQYCD